MSSALQLSTSTSVATPLTFSVPLKDLGEFTGVPEARRNEVNVFLKLVERLHELRGQGNVRVAAQTIAATAPKSIRTSASTLLRKYYAYLGSEGDWRSLLRNYKGPSTMPAKFVSYVKGLAEDNHRSMAAAWELLIEQWRGGVSIPGYGTWSEYYIEQFPMRDLPKVCPRAFKPAGWSDRNLYRKAPNKGARVLFQRGLAAAKRHFPSMRRDPSGLKPLELIVIDDFQLDVLCFFPGDAKHAPQIAPVAGLLAKCVGMRRNLVWGIGAMIEREEKQKDGSVKKIRSGIRRVDVQNLLHDLFAKFGLPDYPITILCENATAAISAELELAFATLFEGRVRIERTNLIDHRTLTNGFTERGGTPWEKGWIESTFNFLWNKLGNMPGYKGSNQRLNAPGDLEHKLAVSKLLLGQGERALNLPPEAVAQLRLPFPSPEQCEQAFAWALAAQDNRTKHNYIGFDGVTEFLLEEGGEPQPFTALALLDADQQQSVQLLTRKESPIERWDRFAQRVRFTAVPPSVLALLLLKPLRVSYRNHAVTFNLNREGFTYVDEAGDVLSNLQDGTELLAYFDQANPLQLFLADLKGAYVGTLNRHGGKRGLVDIRDKEALSKAAGVQHTLVNRVLSELRERHADQDAQIAADKAHNAAIVEAHKDATDGMTKAERIGLAAGNAKQKQAERSILEQAEKRRVAKITPEDVSDFLGKDEAPTTAPTAAGESLSGWL